MFNKKISVYVLISVFAILLIITVYGRFLYTPLGLFWNCNC